MKRTTTKPTQPTKPAPFNIKPYLKGSLSQDDVWQIKQSFDLFDIQGKGYIDYKQLKSVMNDQGYQTKNQLLYHIFNINDNQANQVLSFDQFFSILTLGISDKNTKDSLNKIFTAFDYQKIGFLSIKNLRKITKQLGENIDQTDLQEMIEKADLDNDGLVSAEEFYQIMAKKIKSK